MHNSKMESLSLQHSRKQLEQPMKIVFIGTNPLWKKIHQTMLKTYQALKEGTSTTCWGGHHNYYLHLIRETAGGRGKEPRKGGRNTTHRQEESGPNQLTAG
jgi:hypothetical protein